MTKIQKISALDNAMKQSERDDKTKFYHFTDSASEELKNLYLEHYEVRDGDYERFSTACDTMSELYAEKPEDIDEAIYERASDCASYYTADRLAILDIWNQDEISDNVRQMDVDISEAAAIWYDKEVENMCFIIKNWVEEKK